MLAFALGIGTGIFLCAVAFLAFFIAVTCGTIKPL